MKASILNHPRKGFTLIELLIVIAILASLGGVGYGVYFSMFDKGKASAAKQVCVQLATASETFFQDYMIPPFDLTQFNSDEEQLHFATDGAEDGGIVNVLMGEENEDEAPDGRLINPRKQQYITGNIQDTPADGLYQDQDGKLAYYDPWGSPYYIIYNESDRGAIDPFVEKSRPLRGKHFLVYSLGPDQEGIAPIAQEVKEAKKASAKEAKKAAREAKKAEKKMTKKEKAAAREAAKEAARIASEDEKATYEDNVFSWKN